MEDFFRLDSTSSSNAMNTNQSYNYLDSNILGNDNDEHTPNDLNDDIQNDNWPLGGSNSSNVSGNTTFGMNMNDVYPSNQIMDTTSAIMGGNSMPHSTSMLPPQNPMMTGNPLYDNSDTNTQFEFLSMSPSPSLNGEDSDEDDDDSDDDETDDKKKKKKEKKEKKEKESANVTETGTFKKTNDPSFP